MEPKSLMQIISEQEFLVIIKEPFELFFTISNDFEKTIKGKKDVIIYYLNKRLLACY